MNPEEGLSCHGLSHVGEGNYSDMQKPDILTTDGSFALTRPMYQKMKIRHPESNVRRNWHMLCQKILP